MGNSVTVVLKALGFLPPPPQRSFQLRRHPHRLFQSQDPYPEVCFAIFNNLRTDVFINALKEILKDIPSLNSDYGSEIVLQSEFLPSNRHLDRAFVNLNLMTSLETYTPQMSPHLKNEADQHSSTQEKETTFTHKLEGIQASLPPSFTALLTDCCAEVCQGRYVAPVKQEKLLILHDDSIPLIEICRFRFSPIKSLRGS